MDKTITAILCVVLLFAGFYLGRISASTPSPASPRYQLVHSPANSLPHACEFVRMNTATGQIEALYVPPHGSTGKVTWLPIPAQ